MKYSTTLVQFVIALQAAAQNVQEPQPEDKDGLRCLKAMNRYT